MSPVLMLIQPKVPGVDNPAWFVRYSSGHIVWASNAETHWCNANGVSPTEIEMGQDQYDRLIKESQGWPSQISTP